MYRCFITPTTYNLKIDKLTESTITHSRGLHRRKELSVHFITSLHTFKNATGNNIMSTLHQSAGVHTWCSYSSTDVSLWFKETNVCTILAVFQNSWQQLSYFIYTYTWWHLRLI